jgi:hypothetical protein
MKTILPLLLILLLPVGAFAQVNEKVLAYYKAINLAELAICDSNFAQANKHYKEAFTINKEKPFSKDLLNAFYAAMDTKEYALAETYLAKMLSRYINTKVIDSTFYKNYSGEQLDRLKPMFARHPNKYLGNKPLAIEIEKMIQWDQEVRMHFAEMYDGAYMVDSTFYVDNTNGKKLLEMFRKNGVPNEDVIGNGGYPYVSPRASPDFNILILHAMGGGERYAYLPFDTVLYKAVNTFDFDIRIFVQLINGNQIKGSFRYGGLALNFPVLVDGCLYKGNIYTDYWDEASEKEIDMERAKIGLEPLEDFRKKLATSNRGRNDILGKYELRRNMTVMEVSIEERFQKFLSTNTKGSTHNGSLADARNRKKEARIGYGYVYDDIIGKTNIDSIYAKYGIGDWLKRPIPYQNWQNRVSPLKWGQHAEMVRNPAANISSDTGRYNQAKFLPGYRFYCSAISYDYGMIDFKNEESIFENNWLISFTADVDSGFYRYKSVTNNLGKPVMTIKADTLRDGTNRILKTKRYTWKKENNKSELTVSEYYNFENKKRVRSVFQMTDVRKYEAYLKKVNEEADHLKKQYLANKR